MVLSSNPGFTVFSMGPLHDLSRPPKGQVPALDAMRACAIALVISQHGTTAYLANGGSANLFSNLPFVRGGWIGVDLFFVLSGYFIGKQLWRELQKTGTISFGRFMLRRGFRIWPLYFFFLAYVLLVLGRGGGPSALGWSDAVFLTNYISRGVVMGSWSLCTEEQFYIITPLLLTLGACRIKSIRGFRGYLIGILLLLPLVRGLIWWRLTGGSFRHDSELFPNLYFPIHTHSDGLVMGLLLSNLEAAEGDTYKKGFLATGWCVLAALVACVLLKWAQREILDFSGITLFFGAAVWYLLSTRTRWLSFLDWRIFYVISRLSYGMYLNHEYIHERIAAFASDHDWHAVLPGALSNVAVVAILFTLSACISVVTFCAVEYPFLRMRERVLARRDEASPESNRHPAESVGGRAAPGSQSFCDGASSNGAAEFASARQGGQFPGDLKNG
jgi:peptidoglycan/LPS O-acetylase OafA/YrhL